MGVMEDRRKQASPNTTIGYMSSWLQGVKKNRTSWLKGAQKKTYIMPQLHRSKRLAGVQRSVQANITVIRQADRKILYLESHLSEGTRRKLCKKLERKRFLKEASQNLLYTPLQWTQMGASATRSSSF